MEFIENNKVLKTLKVVVWVLTALSIIASIAAVTVLVMYNFADVFTIYTDDGTKYAAGFSYPGYQSIFYGFGNMIIQGYTESWFNIWLFLGFFLPLVACIVAFVILLRNFNARKTNMKKAVWDIIAGVLLIVGGILLFNCDVLWANAAKAVTDSYTNYYEVYLVPAMNGELYFGKDTFPTIVLVVCLVSAVLKLVNGCVLLFQKFYARKVQMAGK